MTTQKSAAAGLASVSMAHTIGRNKTRQGYARKSTLKPAGYLHLGYAHEASARAL